MEIGQYYYLPISASYSITLSNGVTIDNTGGHAYRFVIIKKDNNGLISVMVVTVETLSPQPPSSSVLYNDISYITLNTTPYPYYKTTSQMKYDDYYAILFGDDWNGEFYQSSGQFQLIASCEDKIIARFWNIFGHVNFKYIY